MSDNLAKSINKLLPLRLAAICPAGALPASPKEAEGARCAIRGCASRSGGGAAPSTTLERAPATQASAATNLR